MTKELPALIKRLSRQFPDVRLKQPMIIFPPLQTILKGLYFERSGSDASRFYLWVFSMPLCVPAEHVTFNLGRRIGNKDQRWNLKDPQLVEKIILSIISEALPFLESVENRYPHEVARFALSMAGSTRSPHVQQACAYLLARSGETSEASKSLDELLHLLNLDVPWQAEMAIRARNLKLLLVNRSEDARAQLQSWEVETINNLGLEDIGFAVPAR